MADDEWLNFGDPAERRAAHGPALISRPPLGPNELLVAEQMHRRGMGIPTLAKQSFAAASSYAFFGPTARRVSAKISGREHWDRARARESSASAIAARATRSGLGKEGTSMVFRACRVGRMSSASPAVPNRSGLEMQRLTSRRISTGLIAAGSWIV